MAKIEREELLKLYEIVVKEEHDFLEAHQTRVKFYTSIISALFAASVAGIIKSTAWYHLISVIIGPILTFSVSSIAVEGTFRLYQRFLETVTIRAKIEQALKLTDRLETEDNSSDLYWPDESLIPPRHIEKRKKYASTKLFLQEHSEMGYHRSSFLLFKSFKIISAILFIGILVMALYNPY